jgi:hypothetical protein
MLIPFKALLHLPKSLFITLLSLCMLAMLGGCKPVITSLTEAHQEETTQLPAADISSVMSDSVNYMHERGVQFTLYDLSTTPPTAIGGSIVQMLATGGDKGCCLKLPKVWRPGIKVRLGWEESDRERTYPEKYTRDLEVPRYAEPADLYVVFYPDHDVEIVVSKGEPGHPDWQGRIKETPWENCLAHNERKVCKRATARIFDTNAKGVCTYFRAEKFPDADANCQALMQQCMLDYEDESFCKGILWGEFKK